MAKKYDEDFEHELEEIIEDFPEVVEEVVPEPVKVLAKTYTVVAGDSFASIAGKFKPSGKTKHEYAKELVAKNGSLTVGKVIAL